jgi:hypothetical protein
METTFDGWPAAGLSVLVEIAADNRADRWPALRERYSASVRGPTLTLARALEAEFGPVRVFRPHVSRRFRPDTPPLRTDTGGVAASSGGCALAVVLSPSGLTLTAGHWRFDPGQLRRYRAAVAGDGSAADDGPAAGEPAEASTALAEPACTSQSPGHLRGASSLCEVGSTPVRAADPGAALGLVLERLAADGMVLDPEGELRGTPRGWRSDHPRIALARRRGLQVVRRWEGGAWIATPEPLERVRAGWRAAAALVGWLDTYVGPAGLPP